MLGWSQEVFWCYWVSELWLDYTEEMACRWPGNLPCWGQACAVEPGGNLSCSEQAIGEVFCGAGHSSAPGFPSHCADPCLALDYILQGCQQ